MFFFVLRRLLVSLPILLAASLLSFWLVIISGDPLAALRQSTDPNRETTILQLRINLDLDKPFLERYWTWLTGVLRGDFGLNRDGQEVSAILTTAMSSTFRLVILATILSIVVGVILGVITAVRQYSAIDYSSTFVAFLFFSLPVFWVAVMLKEFGAIKYNDYLENPGLSTAGIVVSSVIAGLFVAGLVGGSLQRRLTAAVAAIGISVAILAIVDATDWVSNPGFSPLALAIMAILAGLLAAVAFAPFSAKRVFYAGVGAAIVGLLLSGLFSDWVQDPTWTQLFLLFVMTIGTGALVGAALGGEIDRRPAIQAGVAAAFVVGGLVSMDQFISAWAPGRTIGTIGRQTPNLEGPFWFRMVDYAGHQILPSLALALIGFATFTRFTRSSMLDTLKSDYVRTAKAKGLPATQVILRHAFRTALIPVMTVITISFATVIEGAVITETVFGWKGMGVMFIEGLNNIDPYPVMAFLVVSATSIVLLNAIADILYAYLDPRIRR